MRTTKKFKGMIKPTKLSIIIPVYNESATVLMILEKIIAVQLLNNIQKELIIVDDCSTDDSQQLIHHFIKENSFVTIHFYEHTKNKGKGASIQTGISHATGDFLIVQDADLEYDPNEYNVLLEPILQNEANVVYGSRFFDGKSRKKLFFWQYIGNKSLTILSNMVTGFKLTDMETCYKLFTIEIIQSITLTEQRFGFEPEVTAKLSRIHGVRLKEVSISYYGRDYHEGKKIGWKDAVRAIYCILKYGLFRMN